MTEGKLQVAQEHIESLEQQLADAEKKVSDANQRGIAFITYVFKNIAKPAFMVALYTGFKDFWTTSFV